MTLNDEQLTAIRERVEDIGRITLFDARALLDEIDRLKGELGQCKNSIKGLERWRDMYNECHDQANKDVNRIWELRKELEQCKAAFEYANEINLEFKKELENCKLLIAARDATQAGAAEKELRRHQKALELACELMVLIPNGNIRHGQRVTKVEHWLAEAQKEIENETTKNS